MKKLFLLSILSFALTSFTIAQNNFYFTYYEVYKTKAYDSVALWKNLKKAKSYESAGTVFVNIPMKRVRITLKDDRNFIEQEGVRRFTETGFIMGNGWIAVRDGEENNPVSMGVFKDNHWVVYYKKKPKESLSLSRAN